MATSGTGDSSQLDETMVQADRSVAAKQCEERARDADHRLLVEIRAPLIGWWSDDEFPEKVVQELDSDEELQNLKEMRDRLYDQANDHRYQLLHQQIDQRLFEAALENLDAILRNHESKTQVRLSIFEFTIPLRRAWHQVMAIQGVPAAVFEDQQRRRCEVLVALIGQYRTGEAADRFRAQLATTRTWQELQAMLRGEITRTEYEEALSRAISTTLDIGAIQEQGQAQRAVHGFLQEYRRTLPATLATTATYDMLKLGAGAGLFWYVASAGKNPAPTEGESADVPSGKTSATRWSRTGSPAPGQSADVPSGKTSATAWNLFPLGVSVRPYDDLRSDRFDPRRWQIWRESLSWIYKREGGLHFTADGRRNYYFYHHLRGVIPPGRILRVLAFDFQSVQAVGAEGGIVFEVIVPVYHEDGKLVEFRGNFLHIQPRSGAFECDLYADGEKARSEVWPVNSVVPIRVEITDEEIRFFADGRLRAIAHPEILPVKRWGFYVIPEPGTKFHGTVRNLYAGYSS